MTRMDSRTPESTATIKQTVSDKQPSPPCPDHRLQGGNETMNMHIPSTEVADANLKVVDDDIRLDRLLAITDATGKSIDTMEAQSRGMDVQTFNKWADEQMATCDQTSSPDARLVELQAVFTDAVTNEVVTNNALHGAEEASFEGGEGVPLVTTAEASKRRIQEATQAVEHAKKLHDTVLNEICNTPATSIAGILVKLEIWQQVQFMENAEAMALDEFPAYDERMAVAALRDARRLAIA